MNGVLHTYTLDGTKILRETWDGNTLVPLYDNEDSVCGIVYNATPYYFVKNLQGDVIAIVDKDAQTVAEYSYDAWGVCTITQDSVGIANINPFRYRGYYYDAEIAKYYLQSRYYDPDTGRFVNGDELESLNLDFSAISCNTYSYCSNSCVTQIDILGFVSISQFFGYIKKMFQSIGSFFAKAFTYVKKNYSPFKLQKSKYGTFLYINVLIISTVIDVVVSLISKAISLGLKGLLSLVKGLAKKFKNVIASLIKDSAVPFFKKTVCPFLQSFIKLLAKKLGLTTVKEISVAAANGVLPNTGTICSWLISSVSSIGTFISFILDLSDGLLDNYYCVRTK